MKFINSSQRAIFRHPNEAFLYDLDGSLTGSNVTENYTVGGRIRGSSMVGTGCLLPESCRPTEFASGGTGGSICTGFIFRKVWFMISNPSLWKGKALCVRTPLSNFSDRNQSLCPQCNCLPFLKHLWSGNIYLAAEGRRFDLQVFSQELYSSCFQY